MMPASNAATDMTTLAGPAPEGSLPFDRALRVALDEIDALPALPVRSSALATCHDRVLVERIRVQNDLPLRDVAAVDGYALSRAACRGEGPWRLRLTGRIAAARNTATAEAFPNREAVRVTAGAPVPSPLDTVVPADTARRDGDYITLTHKPGPDDAIRARAADARCGDAIAEPDRVLNARTIAVLASAGYSTIKVRRTLRVGVLAMGNTRHDKAGAASRTMLMSMLDRRWIGAQDLGVVPGGAMVQTLRTIPDDVDMTIALDRGGMAAAIQAAGGRIILDGVGMHPGGIVKLAILNGMALLLLPEDPITALTAMTVLGWPLLRRRVGIQHSRSVPRTGIAAFSLNSEGTGARFPLIRVAGAGAMPTLEAMEDRPGSDTEGTLTRLALADGIAVLAPGESVRFGGRVTWLPLTERFD